jgi:hypothetical protein
MKETKIATVESKIIKEIFSVEKYAVVEIIPRYREDSSEISYYEPKIRSMHESKDDAVKYIQRNDSYGMFIVSMAQLLKKQYAQS